MNYFYVDNDNFIIGYTNLKTDGELKTIIPAGYDFYYFEKGDDLQNIVETQTPAGTGTGAKIDY